MGGGGYHSAIGGGAIKLDINGTLENYGWIGADGTQNTYGGGAGGSVWILAKALVGTGKISANGGHYASDYRYAGGGAGRVAIDVVDNQWEGETTACGGSASNYPGQAGTVYETILGRTSLRIDNCGNTRKSNGAFTSTYIEASNFAPTFVDELFIANHAYVHIRVKGGNETATASVVVGAVYGHGHTYTNMLRIANGITFVMTGTVKANVASSYELLKHNTNEQTQKYQYYFEGNDAYTEANPFHLNASDISVHFESVIYFYPPVVICDVLYYDYGAIVKSHGPLYICPESIVDLAPKIYGCTNAGYQNYNKDATVDDGSCSNAPIDVPPTPPTEYVYGCTYPTALNYNPAANVDDHSCEFEWTIGDPNDAVSLYSSTLENGIQRVSFYIHVECLQSSLKFVYKDKNGYSREHQLSITPYRVGSYNVYINVRDPASSAKVTTAKLNYLESTEGIWDGDYTFSLQFQSIYADAPSSKSLEIVIDTVTQPLTLDFPEDDHIFGDTCYTKIGNGECSAVSHDLGDSLSISDSLYSPDKVEECMLRCRAQDSDALFTVTDGGNCKCGDNSGDDDCGGIVTDGSTSVATYKPETCSGQFSFKIAFTLPEAASYVSVEFTAVQGVDLASPHTVGLNSHFYTAGTHEWINRFDHLSSTSSGDVRTYWSAKAATGTLVLGVAYDITVTYSDVYSNLPVQLDVAKNVIIGADDTNCYPAITNLQNKLDNCGVGRENGVSWGSGQDEEVISVANADDCESACNSREDCCVFAWSPAGGVCRLRHQGCYHREGSGSHPNMCTKSNGAHVADLSTWVSGTPDRDAFCANEPTEPCAENCFDSKPIIDNNARCYEEDGNMYCTITINYECERGSVILTFDHDNGYDYHIYLSIYLPGTYTIVFSLYNPGTCGCEYVVSVWRGNDIYYGGIPSGWTSSYIGYRGTGSYITRTIYLIRIYIANGWSPDGPEPGFDYPPEGDFEEPDVPIEWEIPQPCDGCPPIDFVEIIIECDDEGDCDDLDCPYRIRLPKIWWPWGRRHRYIPDFPWKYGNKYKITVRYCYGSTCGYRRRRIRYRYWCWWCRGRGGCRYGCGGGGGSTGRRPTGWVRRYVRRYRPRIRYTLPIPGRRVEYVIRCVSGPCGGSGGRTRWISRPRWHRSGPHVIDLPGPFCYLCGYKVIIIYQPHNCTCSGEVEVEFDYHYPGHCLDTDSSDFSLNFFKDANPPPLDDLLNGKIPGYNIQDMVYHEETVYFLTRTLGKLLRYNVSEDIIEENLDALVFSGVSGLNTQFDSIATDGTHLYVSGLNLYAQSPQHNPRVWRVPLDDFSAEAIEVWDPSQIDARLVGANQIEIADGFAYFTSSFSNSDWAANTFVHRIKLSSFGSSTADIEIVDTDHITSAAWKGGLVKGGYFYTNTYAQYATVENLDGKVIRIPTADFDKDAIEVIDLTQIDSSMTGLNDIVGSDTHLYVVPGVTGMPMTHSYEGWIVQIPYDNFTAEAVVAVNGKQSNGYGSIRWVEYFNGFIYTTTFDTSFQYNKNSILRIPEDDFSIDGVQILDIHDDYQLGSGAILGYTFEERDHLLTNPDWGYIVDISAMPSTDVVLNTTNGEEGDGEEIFPPAPDTEQYFLRRRLMSYIPVDDSCAPPTYPIGPICYDNDLVISCGHYGKIVINDAFYGRREDLTCPEDKDTQQPFGEASDLSLDCSAENAKNVVQGNCQGRSSCSLAVSNEEFGEPCFGVSKYLELDYSCVFNFDGPQCEDFTANSAILSCVPGPDGPVFICADGFYGDTCQYPIPTREVYIYNSTLVFDGPDGVITFTCGGGIIYGTVIIHWRHPNGWIYTFYTNIGSPGTYVIRFNLRYPWKCGYFTRVLRGGTVYYGGIPGTRLPWGPGGKCHISVSYVCSGCGGYPRWIDLGEHEFDSPYRVYPPVCTYPPTGTEIDVNIFVVNYDLNITASKLEIHIVWIGGEWDPNGPYVYVLDGPWWTPGSHTWTFTCGCLTFGGEYEIIIKYWDPHGTPAETKTRIKYIYYPIDDGDIPLPPLISFPVACNDCECGCAYVGTATPQIRWNFPRVAVSGYTQLNCTSGACSGTIHQINLPGRFKTDGDFEWTIPSPGPDFWCYGCGYTIDICYVDEYGNLACDNVKIIYYFSGYPEITAPGDQASIETKHVNVSWTTPIPPTTLKITVECTSGQDVNAPYVLELPGHDTDTVFDHLCDHLILIYSLKYKIIVEYCDSRGLCYTDHVIITYLFKEPPTLWVPEHQSLQRRSKLRVDYHLPAVATRFNIYIIRIGGPGDGNAPYNYDLTNADNCKIGNSSFTIEDIKLVFETVYRIKITYFDRYNNNMGDDQADFTYLAGPPTIISPEHNSIYTNPIFKIKFELPQKANNVYIQISCSTCTAGDSDAPYSFTSDGGDIDQSMTFEGIHEIVLSNEKCPLKAGNHYTIIVGYTDPEDVDMGTDSVTIKYVFAGYPLLIRPYDGEVFPTVKDDTVETKLEVAEQTLETIESKVTVEHVERYIPRGFRALSENFRHSRSHRLKYRIRKRRELTRRLFRARQRKTLLRAAYQDGNGYDSARILAVKQEILQNYAGTSWANKLDHTNIVITSINGQDYSGAQRRLLQTNDVINYDIVYETENQDEATSFTDELESGSQDTAVEIDLPQIFGVGVPCRFRVPGEAVQYVIDIELVDGTDENAPYQFTYTDANKPDANFFQPGEHYVADLRVDFDFQLVFLSKYLMTVTYTDLYGNELPTESHEFLYTYIECPTVDEVACDTSTGSCNVTSDTGCQRTATFEVPLGVYFIYFEARGADSPTGQSGYTFGGQIRVRPRAQVVLKAGGFSYLNAYSGAASTMEVDGELYVVAAAGGASQSGGDFYLDGDGEGFNATCNCLSGQGRSFARGDIIDLKEGTIPDAVFTAPTGGTTNPAFVFTSWTLDCPEDFTLLHSDYNPILLPSSSLYIVNGEPLLQVNVRIPYYYYNAGFEYVSQCSVLPNVTQEIDGCFINYYTSINYVDHCSFEFAEAPGGESYVYRGRLTVTGKLTLIMVDDDNRDYQIERSVSSPINWEVSLVREITVTADVSIFNNHTCFSDDECNNRGCCEEGFCNCECDTYVEEGYTGTYCEVDDTPPVCGHGWDTYTHNSVHGGCLLIHERGLLHTRNYTDNSQPYGGSIHIVNKSISINTGSGEDDLGLLNDHEFCFPIGTTTVTYTIKDNSENYQTCDYQLTVVDKEDPMVDCDFCQQDFYNDGKDEVYVCEGTTNPAVFNKIVLNITDFNTLINDESLKSRGAKFTSYLPGQFIDHSRDSAFNQLTDSFGPRYLTCDCTASSATNTVPYEVTNVWNSWGFPASYDAHDGFLTTNDHGGPVSGDALYNLTYTVSDTQGNQGSCDYKVLYDSTKPTCVDFYKMVQHDPTNRNYSLPVYFPVIEYDADISGLNGTIELDPPRVNGSTYYTGYNASYVFDSTYTIRDLAGNENTCSWRVWAIGSNCTYPTCDDTPPEIVTCPVSYTINCTAAGQCGCGDWDVPTFKDDKDVRRIENSHEPDQQLVLGKNNITYTAYDYHNASVTCAFTVTLEDLTKPYFVGCPASETIPLDDTDSFTYNYSFTAQDDCVSNTGFTFETIEFPSAAELDSDGFPDGSEVLAINTQNTFTYIVKDDSGNPETCTWQVNITDIGKPDLTCQVDITRRNEQGTTSTAVSYNGASATDASGDTPTIVYDPPSGTSFNFTDSPHTVIVSATDGSDNVAYCNFTVTILEAYPYAEFDAVLSSAIVSETNNVFGADLEFETFMNAYHRVSSVSSTSSDVVSGPGASLLNTPDCSAEDALCREYWSMKVQFSGCEINRVEYPVSATTYCRPSDCTEDKDFNFVISMSAANYCWQELAEITVTSELRMVAKADHDSYLTDYTASPTTATLPNGVTAFAVRDEIAGIVFVSSNDVLISNVLMTDAHKYHYLDGEQYDGTTSADYDLTSNIANSEQEWASFIYQELDIPLETTWYTKYTASVVITYNLNARRRLLTRDLEAAGMTEEVTSQQASAEVISFANPINEVQASKYDGIAVLSLTNCAGQDTDAWTMAIANVVSSYLRIEDERVSVVIGDTSSDSCFVEVTIQQTDCEDTVDIVTLFEYFEFGISDDMSEIHLWLHEDDSVPTSSRLDPTVFFVQQIPNEMKVSSVKAGFGEHIETDNASWYMFMAVGFIAIILLCSIIYYVFLKNRKN
jgi:hypothetical protein